MIEAVVFDIGETLIDETRIWTRWADRLGVTPLVMMGLVGATAAQNLNHREALKLVVPDFDLEAESARWAREEPDSLRSSFDGDDLYDDVVPTLEALAALGIPTWLAGNQPAEARAALMSMNLAVRAILNSSDLGVEKPDRSFFTALATAIGHEPARILYVGDRLDNDIVPAKEAGLRTVLMKRGPWGYLHSARPDAVAADAICTSLLEIPAVVRSL